MINVELVRRKLEETRTAVVHQSGYAAALVWVLEEAGGVPVGDAAAAPVATEAPTAPKKLPRQRTPYTKYVLAIIDKAGGPLTPLEICNELKARGVTISEEECLRVLRRLTSAGLLTEEGAGFEDAPEGGEPNGTES
ncbi:hypothetical protein FBZ89_109208 [Nitrospirillum amazonense]|uniref:Uncharacterized protein n=1 Tax=Nitrospirillum amazonense TaxID=28077 RepID=A0A560FB39_9PROT|nr:hypothetical protein [Nitrospirillum amazonense]TWB18822.1 hypothetical protein FBZ89_109208 [Nitrospirillum amazonense]